MKIDTEGTYTLTYTATDSCGNSTSENRTVVVASPRTVLYTDGTFIINELPEDRAANVAAHGEATNTYVAFNPNGRTNEEQYIFSSTQPWYNERTRILRTEIGDEISPTSTSRWFFNCSSITSIDLDNLDTSNVTDMASMFEACNALLSLDLSSFNTSNVTSMYRMFYSCRALTSLDLSSFNTSNVTNMSSMFDMCRELKSLNVSSFNTTKVTTMYRMFYMCDALETSLDLSSFDTSNVTDMGSMFGYYPLASLDLSSFNTSNVTSMERMLNGCSNLSTIYASLTFVVSQVTNSQDMFSAMSTKLVGGAGTTWKSSNPTDKTYAHIDGGRSNPGYFTAKE